VFIYIADLKMYLWKETNDISSLIDTIENAIFLNENKQSLAEYKMFLLFS
jgi:hypothetical protein